MHNINRIECFDAPELDIYARLPEVQLLRYWEPQPGMFLAESAKVIMRALEAGYEPVSLLLAEELLNTPLAAPIMQRCQALPVYVAGGRMLSDMVGYQMTGGMVCAMRRREQPSLQSVCEGAGRIAVLEDVVNPTNVGAIVRSAAALHMDAVVLTAGCCDPLYRRAIRVSMGTIFQIPWVKLSHKQGQPVELLRQLGFKSVAMALTDRSIGIDTPQLKAAKKLAIFLGTEGDGLSEKTIADCDYTVKIPMAHGVDSLNVAAASAVAFWELSKTNL